MAQGPATGEGLRVGLFGIGLDTYWPQFAGLEDRLKGYLGRVADRLQRPGVDVVNLGLVDSPEKAVAAGHRFRQADVDLLFLYITTYALSATVLPVVRRVRVPVDQRAHVVGEIEPPHALDVGDVAALALHGVERVRPAQHRVAAHPAGKHPQGALVELLALRGGSAVGHRAGSGVGVSRRTPVCA